MDDKLNVDITYMTMTLEIMSGKITMGEFTSFLNAISAFNTSLNDIINCVCEMQNNTKILSEVIKYLKIAEYDEVGVSQILQKKSRLN